METFEYRYNPNQERYIARLVKEWKEYGKIVLAVDYDDTLHPWRFTDFNFEEVFKLINEACNIGAHVVIFTSCDTDRYPEIYAYTKQHGITIDAINENPIPLPYGNAHKIYYNHMLCDRSGLLEAMTILSIAMMRIKTEGHNGGENFDV